MQKRNPEQLTRLVSQVFLGVGVLLLGIGTVLAAVNLRYSDAIEVPGTVIAHQARTDEDGTTWAIVVSYVDEAGRQQEITSNYSSSHPAAIGSQVPVQYLPGQPGSVRIATWMGKWFGATLTGGLGGVFAIIGGAVYGVWVRRPLRTDGDAPEDEHRAD